MSDTGADQDQTRDAGGFSDWLTGMRAALRGERTAHVPCGGCTACCTSSQFVHVDPDEADALAHIPTDLLFPAPGLPPGHMVLGYDERGHCPMLIEGRCSIYDHRPRACRTYDCRVFAAAGVAPDQPAVAQQVRRWRFSYPEPAERILQEGVRSRAAGAVPAGTPAVERALRAIGDADL
jgi:Fe-S-cluster containining protein